MKISYVVNAKVRYYNLEKRHKYWWRWNLPRMVNLNALTVPGI